MNVSREVIEDLMVVYLSGDASPATRELVERAMAEDPELRRRAEAAAGMGNLPREEAPANLEQAALEKTQRLLGRRQTLLAVALALTATPLSIAGRGGEITFLLMRDWPWAARGLVLAAMIAWAAYFALNARLRAAGLERKASWKRNAWLLPMQYVVTLPMAAVLSQWGGPFAVWHVGLIAASVGALLWSEGRERLTTANPNWRPTSLFGDRRK
jgi:hypothetical protein